MHHGHLPGPDRVLRAACEPAPPSAHTQCVPAFVPAPAVRRTAWFARLERLAEVAPFHRRN